MLRTWYEGLLTFYASDRFDVISEAKDWLLNMGYIIIIIVIIVVVVVVVVVVVIMQLFP